MFGPEIEWDLKWYAEGMKLDTFYKYNSNKYFVQVMVPIYDTITDTIYFDGLESYYNGDLLILNVVFYENKYDFQHFNVKDAEKLISIKKPKLTILSHFGMTMIKAKPWEIAEKLSKKLGVKVIAASDGMEIDLDKL